MIKSDLLQLITDQLAHDLAVQFNAAKTAHEAFTHEENILDNKYRNLLMQNKKRH